MRKGRETPPGDTQQQQQTERSVSSPPRGFPPSRRLPIRCRISAIPRLPLKAGPSAPQSAASQQAYETAPSFLPHLPRPGQDRGADFRQDTKPAPPPRCRTRHSDSDDFTPHMRKSTRMTAWVSTLPSVNRHTTNGDAAEGPSPPEASPPFRVPVRSRMPHRSGGTWRSRPPCRRPIRCRIRWSG